MSDSEVFRAILAKESPEELSDAQIQRIVEFREEVLRENETQNLTRLLSPRDFFEGHVLDVIHLRKSGLLTYPAIDLGAGMGVPGFLSALIYENEGEKWISSDSEAMKTQFVRRMVEKFGLKQVETTAQRGEVYLNIHKAASIVSRAVGPVIRIYGWIKNSSTWNNLILLKGPKWEEEWADFRKSEGSGLLKLAGSYTYEVGAEKKIRKIVRLERVPRGT